MTAQPDVTEALARQPLHAALLEALEAMPERVERGAERTEGASYRYATEAMIVPPIRRALLAHGITLLVSEASPPRRDETASRFKRQTGEMLPPEHVVVVHLRAILTHAPTGEQLDVDVYGAATDREGRGHSSARTAAFKNLRQAFALVADDPDGRSQLEPPTHDQVAALATELGYTETERDHVIAVWSHTPAEQLAAVPVEQLDAVAAMLADENTLAYRDRGRTAAKGSSS